MSMLPMKVQAKVLKPRAMAARVTGLFRKERKVRYSVIATCAIHVDESAISQLLGLVSNAPSLHLHKLIRHSFPAVGRAVQRIPRH